MSKRRPIRYDAANDLYRVLGILPTATPDDIQRAFRRRAKEVHPDRNPNRLEWANQQFRKLNEAYDVLSDAALRIEYDLQRMRYVTVEHDWWSKPPPRTHSASKSASTPLWTTQARNFYAVVIDGLLKGPYRFVLAIIALIFAANIAFMAATQERRSAVPQAQLILSVAASTLRAASVFVIGTLPAPYIEPTIQPTCANPEVTISEPKPNTEINFESFNIIGSATNKDFWSYTIMVESLDDKLRGVKPTTWVLQTPIREPVKDGYLVRGVSIKNVPQGRYVLRLIVRLQGDRLLPPCEIEIRRKP